MSWRRISSRWIWLVAAVVLVALAVRTHHIGEHSTWQDETKDATAVLDYTREDGLLSGRMVRRVQRFGQPPIGYYFQQLGIANFGFSITGIRMHSAIAGSLLCGLFAVLWLRWLPHGSRAGLLTVGFLVVPVLDRVLVYYSQEGRPYATATLLSALYLFVWYEFVFRGRARKVASATITLVAVQVAYLLSIGFQPAIVLLTACIASIPLSRPRVPWSS